MSLRSIEERGVEEFIGFTVRDLKPRPRGGFPFPWQSVVMFSSINRLLLVDQLRFGVALVRYLWFKVLLGRLRTLAPASGVAENTVSHNLLGLKDLAVRRSLKLIRPLSCIDALGPDSEILSIGPRTEGELLYLVGHGYRPSRIRGLDLITYSPWIDLGDMHELPYPEHRFDAVILGWVLAYSTDRRRAAREVVRVTRPGGFIAIGVEYNPLSNEEIQEQRGYLPGNPRRLTSVAEILELFEGSVDRVYFSHDITAERKDRLGSLTVVFSVEDASREGTARAGREQVETAFSSRRRAGALPVS
ncbi:MAG: methyltransferase domain-containing protein [Planctomycetota bacterium]